MQHWLEHGWNLEGEHKKMGSGLAADLSSHIYLPHIEAFLPWSNKRPSRWKMSLRGSIFWRPCRKVVWAYNISQQGKGYKNKLSSLHCLRHGRTHLFTSSRVSSNNLQTSIVCPHRGEYCRVDLKWVSNISTAPFLLEGQSKLVCYIRLLKRIYFPLPKRLFLCQKEIAIFPKGHCLQKSTGKCPNPVLEPRVLGTFLILHFWQCKIHFLPSKGCHTPELKEQVK